MTAPATSDTAIPSEAALQERALASEPARPVSVDADGIDELSPARSAGDVPADTDRPVILVVEDHGELRAYLRRHLEERYHVLEASNGLEGLEAARRSTPDLILCDIMMPGMDGEELCRAIRSDPELAFLPVIMVTARASRQSRLSALEGGADDYLVKPFDPEELRLRIGNALESRRRFAERLRAEGKEVPFIPLELPNTGNRHDFASAIEGVLRERMADEDFDVDDMAEAMAMSRATLYRKADEILAASPKELLWTFRLRQAAHWLRETDGTVSEIAYASGFKTVPHFTRRFKEHFGTTPAAYRRDEA
jgi:CheY-like chemotaxis protein